MLKNIFLFCAVVAICERCAGKPVSDALIRAEYLMDHSGGETIETVTRLKDLKRIKTNLISEGFTSEVIWIKFVYDATRLNQRHFLVLNETYHDYIDFFEQNGASWDVIRTGDLRPYNARVYPHRGFVFPLKYSSGIHVAWLRISSEDSMNISYSLMSDAEIRNNEIVMGILYGIFLGAISAMIIYNLFIFISLRDISYLYYGLLQLVFICTNVYLMGYLGKYIWPDNPEYNKYYIPYLYGFFVYFTNQFVRSFLELKTYVPKLDSIVYAFALSGLAIFFFSIFSSYRASVIATSSVISINSPLALVVGIVAYRKGNKSAMYYIVAWTFFLSSGFAAVIGSMGLFADSVLVAHLPQMGGLFEAVFFSIALGKRYQLIEESKKYVQGELLEIQEKYTEHLAKEVTDRTQELNKTLQLMNYDLRVARNIQQNVLLKKENHFEGLLIASAYKPHSEVSGDFFDIAERESGKIRFFIADVTGHGVQAALVTMTLKSEYDFFKGKNLSTEKLMEALNNSFHQKFKGTDIFATAFLLDIDLKNMFIEFSSAGHPAQMLMGDSEKEKNSGDIIQKMANKGKPLGILADNLYQSSKISVVPGMRLYLFTDGLTETHNEEMQEFGETRLMQAIVETKEFIIEEQMNSLINTICDFSRNKNLSDDLAFIVAEINP
ncbi:MAG: SpoIIE family protein phosphatase [Spirochaetia bacterium]|nr:SpoIIE family protein phosphatase [Spirochaetia bacterium]